MDLSGPVSFGMGRAMPKWDLRADGGSGLSAGGVAGTSPSGTGPAVADRQSATGIFRASATLPRFRARPCQLPARRPSHRLRVDFPADCPPTLT